MRHFVFAVVAAVAAPATSASAQELGDALAAAYRNNPSLEAARAQARAADESVVQARAAFLPDVSISGSAGVRSSESTLNGMTAPRQDLDPESVSLQASQPIYAGGRLIAQSRSARAQVDLARERLRTVEQNVLLAAITAYVDVRRDEEVLRIRANNVAVLEQQRLAAQGRFEVGEITRTDVAQAQARLAAAVSGLSAARATLERSRAAYAAVIGQPPEGLSNPPDVANLPADFDTALALSQSNSPSVLAAEASSRIADSQVRLATSTLLPQVSVLGAVTRARETSAPDVETDSMSASAQVSIPLFQGGFATSQVRQSRSNAQSARANVEAARRQAISDATGAWSALLAARQVIESSRQQVEASTLALEGVEQEQQVGLRTTLDVLDAEQELLNARLSLVQAERDAYVAAHGVLAASGLLDAGTLGVNVPLYDPADHGRAVQWRFFSLSPPE